MLSGEATDHSAKVPDLHHQPPAHYRKGMMLSALAALFLSKQLRIVRKMRRQRKRDRLLDWDHGHGVPRQRRHARKGPKKLSQNSRCQQNVVVIKIDFPPDPQFAGICPTCWDAHAD
jgi:hypothetical protein